MKSSIAGPEQVTNGALAAIVLLILCVINPGRWL